MCGVSPLRLCRRNKNKDFHRLHHCIMNIKRDLQPKRQFRRSSIRPRTTRIRVLSADQRNTNTLTYVKILSAKTKWMTFVLFQVKNATFEGSDGIIMCGGRKGLGNRRSERPPSCRRDSRFKKNYPNVFQRRISCFVSHFPRA